MLTANTGPEERRATYDRTMWVRQAFFRWLLPAAFVLPAWLLVGWIAFQGGWAILWVLFIAMGVIWGIPYLLIRVAVMEMSPVFVAFARTLIGAALLLPIAGCRGQLKPVLRHW